MNEIFIFNKYLLKISVSLFAFLSLLSCVHSHDEPLDDKKFTQCVLPKPAICTREYKPVCGYEANGNHRTFSNVCVACSTSEINSYDDGACK